MKKIKFIALGVLAFITIASTVFISCRKQQKTITTYSNALAYSKKINEKYNKKNKSITQILKSKTTKAAVTVMADVAGAGTAAATMGSLWLAAPWGTIASAAVTVCAGTSASVLAHIAQNSPINPNYLSIYHEANIKLINAILTLDENPYHNPLDSIGFKHNELVKRYFTTLNNYSIPNANTFLFNSLNLTAEENKSLKYTSIVKITSLLNYQYTHPIENTSSLEMYLNNAYMLYGSNPFLVDFNNTLLQGMYACATYDDLINLAHEYEAYYIPNFQGTDIERRVVLISLATMKYSAKLWNIVNKD
jgi:hypothetical protein